MLCEHVLARRLRPREQEVFPREQCGNRRFQHLFPVVEILRHGKCLLILPGIPLPVTAHAHEEICIYPLMPKLLQYVHRILPPIPVCPLSCNSPKKTFAFGTPKS